ncbi:PQQ-binding-like beta-propeller repeat protein [Henriciella sp. AS95]|uniref:outer membrane protein assembly factor BamB family protein n=1 Tax=Henriciella sp. AS95 TaxID=3135782 RepID=UPI00316E66A1
MAQPAKRARLVQGVMPVPSSSKHFGRILAASLFGLIVSACSEKPADDEASRSEPSQTQTDSDESVETAAAEEIHPGSKIYATRCAACHDNPDTSRSPSFEALQAMSPTQITFSLTSGKMQAQASGLSQSDIRDVVSFIAGEEGGAYTVPSNAMCEDTSISFEKTYVERWGPDLGNTRYYGPERSTLTKTDAASLEVAWTLGLPSASDVRGYPVITEDTVFVGASSGHVFAVDRETGCTKWHNEVGVNLRSSLSLGEVDGKPAILFQDGATNVHALDGATGEALWSKRAGVMPENMGTGSPVQIGDQIIVPLSAIDVGAAGDPNYECCKGHGAVTAISAEDGERLWEAHMTEDAVPTTKSSVGTQLYGPAGAPVWTTPTIDAENNRIYIGTGENTSAPATDTSDAIMALDLETGDVIWTYQATEQDMFNMACSGFGPDGPNCPKPKGPDLDFGGSVSLTKLADGTDVIVGGQKSGVVHVVTADTGELIWKTRVSAGSALGGIHWGLTVANGVVFAPSSDPDFPLPNYDPKPGLYALDLETGDVLWSHAASRTCPEGAVPTRGGGDNPYPDCVFQYGYSAAPASNDELVFVGALDGMMRAFDAETGDVVWEYDTVQAFDSVNGVEAHGGAIDNAGPALAGDMLFVPSGYAAFGQMPGNAFIAFRTSQGD